MANELQLSASGSLVYTTTAALYDTIRSETLQITPAVIGMFNGVVSIGTSEGDISIPNITTLGYLWIKNLDTTNYFRIGPKTGGAMDPMLRLKAGYWAILPLEPGITLRAQANTASVKAQIKVFESA